MTYFMKTVTPKGSSGMPVICITYFCPKLISLKQLHELNRVATLCCWVLFARVQVQLLFLTLSLMSFYLFLPRENSETTSATSANTDLDECLQKEQFEATVVSAA